MDPDMDTYGTKEEGQAGYVRIVTDSELGVIKSILVRGVAAIEPSRRRAHHSEQGMTSLDEERVRVAHAEYYGDGQTGEKMRTVAAGLGVHRSTLSKWFGRLGLPRRPWRTPRLPLSGAELDAAVEAARSGATLEELSDVFDVSVPTIRARLREAGFETNPRRRRTRGES